MEWKVWLIKGGAFKLACAAWWTVYLPLHVGHSFVPSDVADTLWFVLSTTIFNLAVAVVIYEMVSRVAERRFIKIFLRPKPCWAWQCFSFLVAYVAWATLSAATAVVAFLNGTKTVTTAVGAMVALAVAMVVYKVTEGRFAA